VPPPAAAAAAVRGETAPEGAPVSQPLRVLIRSYGCQMNAHDSEKLANLLTHQGYRATERLEQADLLIINTCSIRDKAEQRLYSDIGALRAWRRGAPGRLLGVAGCVAQQQGDRLLARFAHVDFVFGPQNLRLVPLLVESARRGERAARVEESRSLERFDLPDRHPDLSDSRPGRAYVTVMEGCDMFCSFCIVPHTRGREISRPAAEIVTEVERLARRGVREVVLLGQTVNAYGRHDLRRGRAAQAGTLGFGALLERLSQVPGIARLRYTSPHPIFFDDALIRAHGELDALCPHVHLPLQSGSTRVLARMRRRYGADDYRRLVERLRAARADLAITTDLIVGFPGETDADFRDTLALVREVGFVDSYSFKFSPRPGTAAAALADTVPPALAQERLEELQALQRGLTLAAHRARVGGETQVLVEGASRHGPQQGSGRDPYHRVVNFAPTADARPGELRGVRIVDATPHSLIGEPVARPVAPPPRAPVKRERASADEQGRIGLSGEGPRPSA
jgi:tRNA-2-methylthio-N6-dimethylallyladenosine synthase